MTDNEKALLNDRLGDCISQLEQAQAFLAENDFLEAGVFIDVVQRELPRLKRKMILNQPTP